MPDEIRTVCYDADLEIEAYRFEGIAQRFPNHFHDYYVIGFIEKGRRCLICGGQESEIRPGDLLLFNPGDSHACRQIGDEPLDYRCLNIQPEVLKKMSAEIFDRECLPVFTKNVLFRSGLAGSLEELHRGILAGESGLKKEERFLFFLEQLFLEASDTAPAPVKQPPSAELQAVCEFLQTHYAGPVTLDQLSALAGMSRHHLIHCFTRQKGISPYSYLETVRINRAKRLLEQGSMPADAAFATGFHDQSHFTKFFKKHIGLTPKQYRMIFMQETEEKDSTHGNS